MEKTGINNKILYALGFLLIVLTKNVFPKLFSNIYMIPTFFVWLIVFVIIKIKTPRNKVERNIKEKIIYVLLIMFAYYIIYFSLGIFLSFGNNPRNLTLLNIIKNLILYIGTRYFQEILRTYCIKNRKSNLDFFIVTIIFAFIDLSYTSFINSMGNSEKIVDYICSTFITAIARSFLLSYLTKVGGIQLSLSFVIPYYCIDLISPIIPNFDWFVLSAKDLILCIIIYTFINNIQIIKTERVSKRDSKRINPLSTIPIVIALIFFALFMVGIFDYKPMAVMSYSMCPEFTRGDVLIVKKFDKERPELLKEGDIIQYQLENSYIVHRIVEINVDYEGKYTIITKGDNNNGNDAKPVEIRQIHGIVKYIIPYIGYPSVWFSENVFQRQSVVETE